MRELLVRLLFRRANVDQIDHHHDFAAGGEFDAGVNGDCLVKILRDLFADLFDGVVDTAIARVGECDAAFGIL